MTYTELEPNPDGILVITGNFSRQEIEEIRRETQCGAIVCCPPGSNVRWFPVGLDFDKFRQVNVRRCVNDFHHPLESWTLLEWAGALCGEAGEAANYAKKLRRLAMPDMPELIHKGVTAEELKSQLAQELADIVCYADLMAAAAGIDLGEAVRDKFNAVSALAGSEERL